MWWVSLLTDGRMSSLVGTSKSRANMMLLCIQTAIVLGELVRNSPMLSKGDVAVLAKKMVPLF